MLYVAEKIYLEISKIKENNIDYTNSDAIKNFIKTKFFEKLSSGKFHDEWLEKLKNNDFIDQNNKKIPAETIKLLHVQKDMMIKILSKLTGNMSMLSFKVWKRKSDEFTAQYNLLKKIMTRMMKIKVYTSFRHWHNVVFLSGLSKVKMREALLESQRENLSSTLASGRWAWHVFKLEVVVHVCFFQILGLTMGLHVCVLDFRVWGGWTAHCEPILAYVCKAHRVPILIYVCKERTNVSQSGVHIVCQS